MSIRALFSVIIYFLGSVFNLPGTRLVILQHRPTHPDLPSPGVLRPGRRPRHHQVGPERPLVHRQIRPQLAVQGSQRGNGRELTEQIKSIRKSIFIVNHVRCDVSEGGHTIRAHCGRINLKQNNQISLLNTSEGQTKPLDLECVTF